VRFMLNRAVLGQYFVLVFRVPSVGIIPQMLHTHLRVALTRRTNGRRVETYESALSEIGENLIEKYCNLFLKG
jgi:hypothetical protein